MEYNQVNICKINYYRYIKHQIRLLDKRLNRLESDKITMVQDIDDLKRLLMVRRKRSFPDRFIIPRPVEPLQSLNGVNLKRLSLYNTRRRQRQVREMECHRM